MKASSKLLKPLSRILSRAGTLLFRSFLAEARAAGLPSTPAEDSRRRVSLLVHLHDAVAVRVEEVLVLPRDGLLVAGELRLPRLARAHHGARRLVAHLHLDRRRQGQLLPRAHRHRGREGGARLRSNKGAPSKYYGTDAVMGAM